MINKVISNKIYYSTFVLAILVILLHSSAVSYLNPNIEGYSFALTFQRTFLAIGDIAVPTFILISGYLLFSKFTLEDYPRMLLRKVFTLVIPYLIWSSLGFLFIRIGQPLVLKEPIEVTFKSFVLDILLANCCPQIWFVRPLVVFSICSPILYFIFKYLKKWSIFIPIVIFAVYIFFMPNYFGIVFWIPLFFIGCYLSYFKISIQNHYKPQVFAIVSIAILVTTAFLLAFYDIKEASQLYFVYRHFSPVLFWIGIDVIYSLFLKEQVRDIFKISSFMFFSHIFIAYLFGYLLSLGLASTTNYNCAALFILTWILSSIVDVSIGYLLKRFIHPVYKVLTGRN